MDPKDFTPVMIEYDISKTVDVVKMLDIDEANLSEAFQRQAALYAYFSVLTARAEYEWNQAKDKTKEEEALAFGYYKSSEEIEKETGKPCTDGYANQLVRSDEKCIAARSAENRARMVHQELKALSDGLEMRSRMLQSLGADARAEMQMTGMHVSQAERDIEAVKGKFRDG